MRPSLAPLAALAALLAQPAISQDFSIIAELPSAESGRPVSVKPTRLRAGGPLFILSFRFTSVSAWPAGTVAEPIVTPFAGAFWSPGSPLLGDFDGDGFTDLALLSAPNGIVLLRGDGTGRFSPAATLPTGEQQSYFVAADFDGDGRADLAGVNAFQDPPVVSTYLSKGGFRFETPRMTFLRTVTGSFGLGSVHADDLDGDGGADLVVSPYHGFVSVWLGKGDGTFFPSAASLEGYYPGPAVLADIDRDGRLDILYFDAGPGTAPHAYVGGPFTPPRVSVYRNDGGGLFHSIAFFYTYDSGFVVADVKGDSERAIVFSGRDSTGAYLLLQTYGPSGFTSNRLSLPSSPPLFVTTDDAAADWNGDGRDELLVGTEGGVEVLGLSGSRVDVLSVPVLVSTTGLYGTRFDSDLLITNSGMAAAHVKMRYVASKGGGSGTVERDLPAGQQLFAPSAVTFLREAGLPISSEGNVVGTLRIETSGASSPRAFIATVRTTTPAGAGVSYGGVPNLALLRGSSVVPWLIESAKDRTNLALTNAGSDADGPITLRVTVFPGVPGAEAPAIMPDAVLAPGAFYQLNRVLPSAGLSAPLGWARIERIEGNAPYLAWGSVNDAGSGDGSFVPAVDQDEASLGPWIIPNAAQTSRYGTEFAATNPGTEPLRLHVTLVATGTVLEETVEPGATYYVPDLFAEMRGRGLAGAPAAGVPVVSPLYVQGDRHLFAGIRVSSTDAFGRSYGVFEPAASQEVLGGYSMVLPDLRQDTGTRTNLGIVNLGYQAMEFRVELFNGETGALAGTTSRQLQPNELVQLNAVLKEVAPGVTRAWARVMPVLPQAVVWPFAAYAILNDGATPGAGTDDGSFVAGVPQ